ncbi:MAG: acetyltransferase [Moraxellaceae bacterium]|nr:acetyltransferase [Moraxellaceae bacterium]MDZ4385707.1 acetyltransferase [Moraxellaceae bacterium]
MNSKIEIYGVKAIERPKIAASKKLDLSGEFGQQIVKSETKLVLRTHKRTFQKLADM